VQRNGQLGLARDGDAQKKGFIRQADGIKRDGA
jgi:hypothetical protein